MGLHQVRSHLQGLLESRLGFVQAPEARISLASPAAPPGLRRRLGASDQRGDIIFGATAIPTEAWPEHGQFRLTDQPQRVELAIEAARNTAGYWTSELLCTEQHPILQWIGERLLMLVERGEAPLITSRNLEPGELMFVFIGQVSSVAGKPLVVDAHSVSFYPGGKDPGRIHPIHEAMQSIGFDRLANIGAAPNTKAAQILIPAAVERSLEHLEALESSRIQFVKGPLRREERRLRSWSNKRKTLLEERIAELGPKHPRSRKAQRQLQEMKEYIEDRQQNWRDEYMLAAPDPTTRLVLVVEGVH